MKTVTLFRHAWVAHSSLNAASSLSNSYFSWQEFFACLQNYEKRLVASSCLSVRPFVRPSILKKQLGSHWTDSHWIWCWSIFRKSVQRVRASLKSGESNEYFAWGPIYLFWSYLAQFFFDLDMFQPNVVEKIQTHILCSITFFFYENPVVYEKLRKKYCRAVQATDDMAHPHCMLIRKATVTLSEYVIRIAFPLQQWFHERSLTLRWLMSYIYGAPILDISRSHTTTQHSR